VIVGYMQSDMTKLIGIFREFAEASKLHLNGISSILYTYRLHSNIS